MGGIWLLTGPPGVGKSTVVSRVVLRLKGAGVIVGGCVASEKRLEGVRVGFEVRDITNGTQGELASVKASMGPRVGKYRVNLANLASVAAKGLTDAASASEVIVIDELGPMELVSPEFRRGVRAAVDSGRPILAIVHERLEDDLIGELKLKARSVLEVAQHNREELIDRLANELLEAAGGPKAS